MNVKQDARPDYTFLGAVGVLLLFGLLMLTSASSVIGLKDFADPYYFLKRQFLLGILPGIFLGYLALKRGYGDLKRFAPIIYGACLVLLLLVFIPGIGLSYGTFAHRWISLGPINFQPSELMKLGLIVYLSAWLAQRAPLLKDIKQGLVPFGLIAGIPLALIILEPDLGTASVIAMLTVVLFFAAGGQLRYLAMMFGLALVGLAILIYFEPYRLDRLTIFLNPELDPRGIGYHINQAFLAIGSGGWWGRGFGHSRAKFQYLPEVTGDSIFAIIGEELGFVVCVALIALVVFIFLRGLKIAKQAPDPFARYLAIGITTWIGGQAIVNISAMIGLVPLTGIPFPFVSSGGTALAVILGAVGIMGSISRGAVQR